MAKIPDKVRQIAIVHAQLINAVVMTCQNSNLIDHLEPELRKADANGWTELVKRIRKILGGSRKSNLLIGLDEEDAAIILSILVGLQNPEELPKLNQVDQADFAPQAIAKLINLASQGDIQAQTLLQNMANQMFNTQGDMNFLASVIKQLINGDYDISAIRTKMDDDGKKLVDGIVDELGKLKPN